MILNEIITFWQNVFVIFALANKRPILLISGTDVVRMLPARDVIARYSSLNISIIIINDCKRKCSVTTLETRQYVARLSLDISSRHKLIAMGHTTRIELGNSNLIDKITMSFFSTIPQIEIHRRNSFNKTVHS